MRPKTAADPYSHFIVAGSPNLSAIRQHQRDANAFLRSLLAAIHVIWSNNRRLDRLNQYRPQRVHKAACSHHLH